LCETYTRSETHTTQFATNFGIDVDLGLSEKVKIGLKFGGSSTTTNTQTYSLVTNVGSDQLGEAELYFYNPVLNFDLSDIGLGSTYEIQTGWLSLSVEPVRFLP